MPMTPMGQSSLLSTRECRSGEAFIRNFFVGFLYDGLLDLLPLPVCLVQIREEPASIRLLLS